MESIQGEITSLDSFFNVRHIERERTFTWEGIEFNLIKVVHVDNGYFVVPSYGLYFEVDGVKVFLSTDTQIFDRIGEIYDIADIIFQDCEITPKASKVHAHYRDLAKLPEQIKHKIWLYGYQPGELPPARQDGFQGFVKRGQIFDFKDL